MSSKVYAVSDDGLIEYRPLTADKLSQTLELLRVYMFPSESISVAVGLHKHPQAIDELSKLILKTAYDGISLVAVERTTGKVVGCVINKINVKEATSDNVFEGVECEHPSAKTYLLLNAEIDKTADYFSMLHTNCYLELLYLVVSSEYRRRGVGSKLSVVAIELFQKLRSGQNVKMPLSGEALRPTPAPSTIVVISTTPGAARNVTMKSGFNELCKIDFSNNMTLKEIMNVLGIPSISVLKFVSKL